MNFSFSNLSLSGVVAASSGVLSPGRYLCKIAEVTFADTKAGTGKVMKVRLKCEDGVITDNLNVANQNPEAQRIGLEQLKGMLVSAGHPDPDNIGSHGVPSMINLEVGVIVGTETYNGSERSKVKGYCKPSAVTKSDKTPALSAPVGAPVGTATNPF